MTATTPRPPDLTESPAPAAADAGDDADTYRVSLYDYELPEDRIAQSPAARRDAARMLVLRRTGGMEDRNAADLPELLSPGDLLVLNDTRVVPARLECVRPDTGGRVEILFTRIADGFAQAMTKTRGKVPPDLAVRPSAPEEEGTVFRLGAKDTEGMRRVETGLPADALRALLDRRGRTPLPPYIRRAHGADPRDAADAERYQTVFAREPGAVAAPTAGLHFTPELFAALDARGVARVSVTLHVGPGTFKPVTVEDARLHPMHAEQLRISAEAAAKINETRRAGGRIVAVGTTAVRTLESACDDSGVVAAGEGETRLFIRPPYRFRAVDALLTNFHVPRSTLLMLVCAFAGRVRVMDAYRHAVKSKYRMLSYGDAMLLL